MANKTLSARVKLNTTQAEQKLRNISKAIDAINRAAGKQSNAYNQVNSALNKTVKVSAKVKSKTDETTRSTKQWSNALSEVNSKLNGSSRSLGAIGGKLKSLASTYLGLMGTKAIIGTADTITSAENKLNYVNAQNLGAKGKNADGSYNQATFNATQDSMNKMYASAQRVRMGYDDMMSNVSKSMALAGSAFDNSTDKAIRFQEIMAEAYAVGGASAQEMSSSMYQMIQALGSGILAGDELRSVREGAPLAYQAIEKFAQGVYDCDDSLKDMASDGLITSEMVVAAIMNAGDEMDDAFAQTKIRFDQVWTQIKNAATKAFSPVAKLLSEQLTKAVDNGLVQKVTSAFNTIAKVIMIVFTVVKKVIVWIADNWNWLKHIIVGVFILWITWTLIKAGVSIACAIQEFIAWAMVNSQLLGHLLIIGIIIVAILGLLYVFYLWKTGAIDTCQAIVYALLIVAAAILLIGIIVAIMTGSVVLLVIGAILLILAIAFMFFEQVCGGVTWLVMFIVNILQAILGFIMGVIMVILSIAINCILGIINGILGLASVCKAACSNIGIFFSNLWYGASASFWTFIGDVLSGLADLEPAFNAIAELFGLEGVTLSGLTQGAYDKASAAKGKIKDYNSISDAWNEGSNTFDYINLGDAWSSGWNSFGTPFEEGWSSNAYNTGAEWGAGVTDSINQWGSQFQNDKSKDKTSLIDSLANKLGIDFSKYGDGVIDPNDPTWDLSGLDDVGNGVDKIGGDTGKIADAMDLTEEDLKYLRQLAEMEWKKEYTTANITVDMTNNNTINGESDLDGIVTKLSDKLYEEMNIVANGVYVY